MSKPVDLDRFMKFVEKTEGCWIWNGSRLPHGYGTFRFRGKVWRSHRASFVMHVGEIPAGMVVMHKCDVTSCVNPTHLVIGTQQENIIDRINKGRSYRGAGSSNPNARLSDAQVSDIRNRYIPGKKKLIKALASEFGVSRSQILRIGSRECWQDAI